MQFNRVQRELNRDVNFVIFNRKPRTPISHDQVEWGLMESEDPKDPPRIIIDFPMCRHGFSNHLHGAKQGKV